MGVIAPDRVLVILPGEAIEIDLVLLGLRIRCGTAADAVAALEALIQPARGRCTIHLPRPAVTQRFVHTLSAGGIFAGLAFRQTDGRSIASIAADQHPDLWDLDPTCPYLRSTWHPAPSPDTLPVVA